MAHDPDYETECDECNGEGMIWNNADPTSGQGYECEKCNGTGWREMTDDEIADAAESAYERQFEGEPPMSFSERAEMQAKRDAQWGVK